MSTVPTNNDFQWKEFNFERDSVNDTTKAIGTFVITDSSTGDKKEFSVKLLFAGSLSQTQQEQVKDSYGGKTQELIKAYEVGQKIKQLTITKDVRTDKVTVSRTTMEGTQKNQKWNTPDELKAKIDNKYNSLIKQFNQEQTPPIFLPKDATIREKKEHAKLVLQNLIRDYKNHNVQGQNLEASCNKLARELDKYFSLLEVSNKIHNVQVTAQSNLVSFQAVTPPALPHGKPSEKKYDYQRVPEFVSEGGRDPSKISENKTSSNSNVTANQNVYGTASPINKAAPQTQTPNAYGSPNQTPSPQPNSTSTTSNKEESTNTPRLNIPPEEEIKDIKE